MKRNKSVVAAFVASSVFYVVLLIKNFGDASAANDLLSILAPEVRATLMADSTLLLVAIGSHLLAAWLVFRDAGFGAEAVRDAKHANDRAWAFSGEMAAYQDKITAQHDELSAKVDRLSDQFATVIEKLDRLETERERTRNEVHERLLEHFTRTIEARLNDQFDRYKAEADRAQETRYQTSHRLLGDKIDHGLMVEFKSLRSRIIFLENRLQSPQGTDSGKPQ